ncbi:MAG: methylenetetrahydrofolate reductase [Thermodesulfovibrio sp.]|uniref:methylenetetrahydrofolate reductase n=2 Tax=unclassified Thermodesulfovibrio TaxID=2645936 RepID=UPI002482207E|nr:methylenetetrahydrofolate reductase [Thermodesulfovibrio sp. 1176]MDI1472320.1 methylenetetrahydrofolate reductase [Thermodesulfovibrio sp. 1176]MDI6714185.1 methylenetetrahydrofolate reductase [Thermodesulfovibrio sp.]
MTELRKKLMEGEIVITVEMTPPKGPDVTSLVEKLKELKFLTDAVNFTDNPSAKMRMCSMSACKISLDLGFEPVLQMSCRDRNRIAIQSDLLGAHALGIRNLLVMTGDHPVWGDHKEAKAVYDIDSSLLIKLVNNLNNGLDINGNKLNGNTDFFIGAVVNPNVDPLLPQLKRFEQKLKMGAQFFQTQMIFELEKLEQFMDFANKFNNVKIIVGIIIIKTKKMLQFIAEKIPGVVVPQWLIDKVNTLNDNDVEKFGIEFASNIILSIIDKGLANGFHIMAISKVEEVKNLLNYIKIKKI